MGLIKNLFDNVLDSIAPYTCMACDCSIQTNETHFCESCALLIEKKKHGPAAFVYGGPMSEAICKLKYNRRAELAPRFASLLGAHLEEYRDTVNIIVPVPLHFKKLLKRKYNQSSLVASHLAKHLQIPVAHHILKRTKNTPSQTQLKKSKRLKNLENAFKAKHDPRFSKILLFDDIRTTGSTLISCEKALLQAGYKEIRHLTIASQD